MYTRRELADIVYKIMVSDLKGERSDREIVWAIARTSDDELLRFYEEHREIKKV